MAASGWIGITHYTLSRR